MQRRLNTYPSLVKSNLGRHHYNAKSCLNASEMKNMQIKLPHSFQSQPQSENSTRNKQLSQKSQKNRAVIQYVHKKEYHQGGQ